MSPYEYLQNNETWETTRYKIVSDRWGNYQTTISYSKSNKFRIDPNVEYHYLSEEEVKQLEYDEEIRCRRKLRKRRAMIRLIFDLVEQHFTPTQKGIFNSYLKGNNWTDIAQERGCSEANVRQAFYGNSKGQGGIIKKLEKYLKNYKDYFEWG